MGVVGLIKYFLPSSCTMWTRTWTSYLPFPPGIPRQWDPSYIVLGIFVSLTETVVRHLRTVSTSLVTGR